MGLFEQLLEQYNVTAEDVTFEHENLTDEELKAKFEEMFGSAEADPAPESNFEDEADSDSAEGGEAEADNEPEAEEEGTESEVKESEAESQEDTSVVQDDAPAKKVENSIIYNVNGKEFAVSLNDKIYALGTLVNDTYSESDNAYYSVLVYDKELVMVDVWAGSAYRQAYSERSGVFSLKGDRVPVHAIYVTDTEEQKIDEIRSNYSVVCTELEKYHAAEENAKKEAIINSKEWALISDNEKFAALKANFAEYSVEELQNKCDAILLETVKSGVQVSNVPKDTKEKHVFSVFRVPEGQQKEVKRYGNIFD